MSFLLTGKIWKFLIHNNKTTYILQYYFKYNMYIFQVNLENIYQRWLVASETKSFPLFLRNLDTELKSTWIFFSSIALTNIETKYYLQQTFRILAKQKLLTYNVTSNLIKLLSGSWLLKKDLGFVYKGSDKQLCVTTFVICFEDLGFTTQSYIFHFHVS